MASINDTNPALVVRGIAATAMIVVATPGTWDAIYPGLRTSEWHGCTPADLAMPLFLFASGAVLGWTLPTGPDALPAGFRGRLCWSCVAVFLLGVALNAIWSFDLSNLRITGPLQRLALCTLAAGMVAGHLRPRAQAVICVVLLAGYWALFLAFDSRTPAALVAATANGNAFPSPINNPVRSLDLFLLGPNHISSRQTDPDGLLSTFPAVVTTLAGVWTARVLRRGEQDRLSLLLRLLCLGFVMLLAGSVASLALAINKTLWTPSFVVLTAGWALLVLLIAERALSLRFMAMALYPLTVAGRHAVILLFVSGAAARLLVWWSWTDAQSGARQTAKAWLFNSFFARLTGEPAMKSAIYAVVYALVWVGILALASQGAARRPIA